MKNKIELKKAFIWSIISVFAFLVIFGFINVYEYKCYTKTFNNAVNSIILEVLEKYPDVDKNEIVSIINGNKSTDNNILYEYGIDLDKDSLLMQNDLYLKKFIYTNTLFLLILSFVLITIFLKYNSSKDKKLRQITKYIEEINNRNYKLDIEDNTEDELSILKNEIYKTTVMLKEVAENSKIDKINLKNSLSDISHQLKTPLTSIIIMLDNILDDDNMDKNVRIEFIKDIKREIININFLVNSLLKLSKLDANSVSFINKKEKISSIVEESIKNVSVLCDLKNIKVNILGDKKSELICDLKWQIEAVTNILKNCVEHSNNNSQIDIEYEQNKLYSKIEIRDYGVGIDKEDLPHIFERFYRGKNSASESVGIGLALSKSIIEKNNGYIDVESSIGHGTVFIIKYFT